MVSAGYLGEIPLVILQNSPNITRRFAARDILVNFEISLAVFIPNTPRNRAISYTNTMAAKTIKSLELHYRMIQFFIMGIITH